MLTARLLSCLPLLLLLLCLSGTAGCPQECFCSSQNNKTMVTCDSPTLASFPTGLPSPTTSITIRGTVAQLLLLTRLSDPDIGPLGPDLTSLGVTYTRLASLDAGTFSRTPHVRHVDLRCNQLAHVEHGTFQALKELSYLDLSGNKALTLDPASVSQLSSLNELYLGDLGLPSLPPGFLDGLASLTVLDLHGNSLESVSGPLLSSLRNLTYLDLSGNKLTALPPSDLQAMFSRLRHVNLASNLWHCGCDLRWLKHVTSVHLNGGDLVVCTTPSRLAYRTLLQIPDQDFYCQPPRIVHCGGPYSVRQGDPLVIQCNVTGDPRPTPTWTTPGGAMVSSSSSQVGRNVDGYGTLSLVAVDTGDNGDWQLEVINSLGKDRGDVIVHVVVTSTTTTTTAVTTTATSVTTTALPATMSATQDNNTTEPGPVSAGNLEGEGLSWPVLVGAACGGLMVLLVVVLLIYVCKRRSSKTEPETKPHGKAKSDLVQPVTSRHRSRQPRR